DMGQMISFLPGVRYEKDTDHLTGWWMPTLPDYRDLYSPPGYSTDSTHNDEYWLPMVHLKIKPVSWFESQISFTQTLNRPSYGMLAPIVNLNQGSGTLAYSSGNPDLKPEFWTNYDIQFAAFGDKIGLISVDGFYKKVKDFIWTPSIYRVSGQPWPYNIIGQYFPDNATVLITIPQNNNFPVYLKGLEFEIQTNLWYLPEPFNYITLSANFTLINSHTTYQYPKALEKLVGTNSKGQPIYQLVSIDSIYSGPMLNQPKSIVNFSFGYNYRGLNLWISYEYTGSQVIAFPNQMEFEDITQQTANWDMQLTQKLPFYGLELVLNFTHINNPLLYQNYRADPRPVNEEAYGWTADFGIRLRL
ncbi:MAG: TonB-dependent receptor domain-containing protein, partial [Ignavibacteriaceae bacterium]